MKKIWIYYILIISGLPFVLDAQKFDWVKHILKTDALIQVVNSDADSEDNLICLAYFFSDPPIYPNVDLCSTYFNPANNDFPVGSLMYKLDKNGNCVWTHQLSTAEGATDGISSLEIDQEDNWYFVSSFSGIIELAPGIFIDSGSPQHTQIVVSKYNKDGNLFWYKILKVRDPTKAAPYSGIHTDRFGNIFLLVDHSFEPLIYNEVPILYNNINLKYNSTIIKLDKNGELVWTKPMQSPNGGVKLYNIKSDYEGNVVAVGNITGKFFQVDQKTYYNTNQSSNLFADAFVFKLLSNGEVSWLKGYGVSHTQDYLGGLEIDRMKNIYLCGVSMNIGPYNILDSLFNIPNLNEPSYIAMLDSNGNRKWIKAFDIGIANNFGNFSGMIKENKLITTWSLTKDSFVIDDLVIYRKGKGAINQYDMVYLITNQSGKIENVYCWGGNDFDRILDVSIQSDHGVIISGQFSSDTLSLGEHSLYKFINTPTGNPSADGFIARISPDGMVGYNDHRNHDVNLISIHPNPAQDLFQIQFDEDLSVDGRVEILTTTGTLMKSINIGKGSTSTTVDCRDWPAGVYFVRYRDTEGRSSVERVVVE